MGLPDRSAAGTGRGMEVFAVTGGMAKNRGLVERLEKVLGVRALKTDQAPPDRGRGGRGGRGAFRPGPGRKGAPERGTLVPCSAKKEAALLARGW
jgi:hypothetical protein